MDKELEDTNEIQNLIILFSLVYSIIVGSYLIYIWITGARAILADLSLILIQATIIGFLLSFCYWCLISDYSNLVYYYDRSTSRAIYYFRKRKGKKRKSEEKYEDKGTYRVPTRCPYCGFPLSESFEIKTKKFSVDCHNCNLPVDAIMHELPEK